jgi:hypothetical protein
MIKPILILTAVLSLSLSSQLSIAQTPAPDNSKANANAANSTNKASTADGQSNDPKDLAITQQIRRSIIADKGLSTYAHNVKNRHVKRHCDAQRRRARREREGSSCEEGRGCRKLRGEFAHGCAEGISAISFINERRD